MGFLEDVQESLNRGMEATSRASTTVKLKAEISEISRRRQDLAMQLGTSLYEATKNDPAFRSGREALYSGIANCDAERDRRLAEIARIEAEREKAAEVSQCFECPFCHEQMATTDQFCSGCGKPAEEIRTALNTMPVPANGGLESLGVCPVCGERVIEKGDSFCMICGAALVNGPGSAPWTSPNAEAATDAAPPSNSIPGISGFAPAADQMPTAIIDPTPKPDAATLRQPKAFTKEER